MTTTFTPNAKNHGGLGPLASRFVQVNDMPWEPIKYPGVFVKTLMLDKQAGLLTALMKMEPGAELPDHEHVLIEQTFVIEGRLVDKTGPDEGNRPALANLSGVQPPVSTPPSRRRVA